MGVLAVKPSTEKFCCGAILGEEMKRMKKGVIDLLFGVSKYLSKTDIARYINQVGF